MTLPTTSMGRVKINPSLKKRLSRFFIRSNKTRTVKATQPIQPAQSPTHQKQPLQSANDQQQPPQSANDQQQPPQNANDQQLLTQPGQTCQSITTLIESDSQEQPNKDQTAVKKNYLKIECGDGKKPADQTSDSKTLFLRKQNGFLL